MRVKSTVLHEALTGHFGDHHGYLLAHDAVTAMDALTAQIEDLTGRIEEAIAPFARQIAQLDEIPGVGKTCAQELIAEIGATWAGSPPPATWSPGPSSLPGPAVGGLEQPTLRPSSWLAASSARPPWRRPHQDLPRPPVTTASPAAAASDAPWSPSATPSWPLPTHLLSDPAARFTDLGPDWHDRLAPLRRKRQLIAELERLSRKKVLLQEAAARPADQPHPAPLRSAGCSRAPS